MRWLLPVVAFSVWSAGAPAVEAQDTAPKLNIVIVEGEGAINNIRQRTAREPIVEVQDENHKPVAGTAVIFALSDQGAGGTFAGGSHTLTTVTDSQGRALARGFRPNHVQGQYQIHVTASQNGQTANTNINMSNVAAAGAATTAAAAGISGKVIAIVVIAVAAAAGGAAYLATHNGSGNGTTMSGTANTPITITPGSGTVGPPK